jgi:hypothetical protein
MRASFAEGRCLAISMLKIYIILKLQPAEEELGKDKNKV